MDSFDILASAIEKLPAISAPKNMLPPLSPNKMLIYGIVQETRQATLLIPKPTRLETLNQFIAKEKSVVHLIIWNALKLMELPQTLNTAFLFTRMDEKTMLIERAVDRISGKHLLQKRR